MRGKGPKTDQGRERCDDSQQGGPQRPEIRLPKLRHNVSLNSHIGHRQKAAPVNLQMLGRINCVYKQSVNEFHCKEQRWQKLLVKCQSQTCRTNFKAGL